MAGHSQGLLSAWGGGNLTASSNTLQHIESHSTGPSLSDSSCSSALTSNATTTADHGHPVQAQVADAESPSNSPTRSKNVYAIAQGPFCIKPPNGAAPRSVQGIAAQRRGPLRRSSTYHLTSPSMVMTTGDGDAPSNPTYSVSMSGVGTVGRYHGGEMDALTLANVLVATHATATVAAAVARSSDGTAAFAGERPSGSRRRASQAMLLNLVHAGQAANIAGLTSGNNVSNVGITPSMAVAHQPPGARDGRDSKVGHSYSHGQQLSSWSGCSRFGGVQRVAAVTSASQSGEDASHMDGFHGGAADLQPRSLSSQSMESGGFDVGRSSGAAAGMHARAEGGNVGSGGGVLSSGDGWAGSMHGRHVLGRDSSGGGGGTGGGGVAAGLSTLPRPASPQVQQGGVHAVHAANRQQSISGTPHAHLMPSPPHSGFGEAAAERGSAFGRQHKSNSTGEQGDPGDHSAATAAAGSPVMMRTARRPVRRCATSDAAALITSLSRTLFAGGTTSSGQVATGGGFGGFGGGGSRLRNLSNKSTSEQQAELKLPQLVGNRGNAHDANM